MDRPIVSRGEYNLNFIDWNNEWERYAEDDEWSDEEQDRFEHTITQALDTKTQQKIKKNLKLMKMGKSKKICVICVKSFSQNEKIYKLPRCKHIFHKDCFTPWIKFHQTCPMCRDDLTTNEKQQLNKVQNQNTIQINYQKVLVRSIVYNIPDLQVYYKQSSSFTS